MTVSALFFYLFASILIGCSVMVIAARNPVHAVLYLILAFFNAAGLFVLLGAEFLAMLLVIVYVGAVAVLFLFVVMMLDVDFVELREGVWRYAPVGAVVGLILVAELIFVGATWVIEPAVLATPAAPVPPPMDITNTEALGRLLYTRYIHFFQISGLILLVAMVGAIVLTLRHKVGVKRQDITAQNRRDPRAAIQVRKVEVGKGI